jgi:pimeloyl-ACP methyl ester carboxylesterase
VSDAIQTQFVEANGQRFEVETCGEGERLALCLHGFPEHAVSWRNQLPLLASLGYRAWAPNQRGYGHSSRPRETAAYAAQQLLADVAGLIDASGARSVTLLGHDWGGILAWLFAIRQVRPLERLVVMNAPHPVPFRAAMRASARQRRRSWYVGFFQLPVVPELLLGLGGAEAIAQLIARSARDRSRFPRTLLDVYKRNAAQPGALRAMIDWYRANVRGGGLAAVLRGGIPIIEVPTLLVWGTGDDALGVETTHGTERQVRDLTLRYLPGVSHWVQQEAPEAVNALLAAFLRGEPVPDYQPPPPESPPPPPPKSPPPPQPPPPPPESPPQPPPPMFDVSI